MGRWRQGLLVNFFTRIGKWIYLLFFKLHSQNLMRLKIGGLLSAFFM